MSAKNIGKSAADAECIRFAWIIRRPAVPAGLLTFDFHGRTDRVGNQTALPGFFGKRPHSIVIAI